MVKRIFSILAFNIAFGLASYIAIGLSFIILPQNTYIYVGIIASATLIIGNLLILGVFKRLSERNNLLIPLLVFVVPLLSFASYNAYISHLEIQNAEINLTTYEPYHVSTEVASLDEESNFKIKHNLPHLDGATALYPVYSAFARAVYPENHYPHSNPCQSEVVVSKTNGAYERLAHHDVDMIFVAGPSDKQELKLGPNMEQTPIGKEAFVFFVHESNPIDSLAYEELQKIYSGEITNWQEVGGRNQEIIAFQRPEGSGSQTGLQNMMGDKTIMTPPTDQRVSGMGGVIEKASDYQKHRNAIGFSYRYFATEMMENNGIKLLEVNDVKPNVSSIQQDKYPLTSEFYVITNGTENPHVDSFIEWMLSEQGQELIEKTGYVPIREF